MLSRSSRIKSIEQKKEKEKEEKERRERIKRQKLEREERERKEKEEYIKRREAQCKEEEVNFIKPSSPVSGVTPFVRPASPKGDTVLKAEKVKSRWRKYCEIEFGGEITPALASSTSQDSTVESPSSTASALDDKSENSSKGNPEEKDPREIRFGAKGPATKLFGTDQENTKPPLPPRDQPRLPPSSTQPLTPGTDSAEMPPRFEPLLENIYLSERKMSKEQKEAKRMLCDCTTCKEDRLLGIPPCGDDCLNRMLFIEW